MSSSAPSIALLPAAAAARFLEEFENACAALRLYGAAHPALARAAEMAAAAARAAKLPLRLAVSPRGFQLGETRLEGADLGALAGRLRLLGLVGLNIESAPTAAQIAALVSALAELCHDHAPADKAVARIARESGCRITTVPLRLEKLRLVEGTNGPAIRPSDSARPEANTAAIWETLFAPASALPQGPAIPADLASALEAAIGPSPSPAEIRTVVEAWTQQLRASKACDASQPASEPMNGDTDRVLVDVAASFLGALNPALSQRLLAGTVATCVVPESVTVALANRLPAGIVLGALCEVGRDNGEPSQAALALLRKMSTHAGAGPDQPGLSPRTNRELAETAASLGKLLHTEHEAAFVPAEYLRRREELSATPLEAAPLDAGMTCPDRQETAWHAADLAFGMLASTEADASHALAGLEFVRQRLGPWVRAGEFALAADALDRCRMAASAHDDPQVAIAARAVAHAVLDVDDLLTGAGKCYDRRSAALQVAALIGHCGGPAIAELLQSPKLKGATSNENVVVRAIGNLLAGQTAPLVHGAIATAVPPTGPIEQCAHEMLQALGNAPAPPPLLACLTEMDPAHAAHVAEVVAAHAGPAIRTAVLHKLFDQNVAWPLPLTERLLNDADTEVRRLATMRLARDCDMPTTARYLSEAADGAYPSDVAAGLAELLHDDRRVHPEVRQACRKWFWSSRRWASMLSLSVAVRGGADPRRRAG